MLRQQFYPSTITSVNNSHYHNFNNNRNQKSNKKNKVVYIHPNKVNKKESKKNNKNEQITHNNYINIPRRDSVLSCEQQKLFKDKSNNIINPHNQTNSIFNLNIFNHSNLKVNQNTYKSQAICNKKAPKIHNIVNIPLKKLSLKENNIKDENNNFKQISIYRLDQEQNKERNKQIQVKQYNCNQNNINSQLLYQKSYQHNKNQYQDFIELQLENVLTQNTNGQKYDDIMINPNKYKKQCINGKNNYLKYKQNYQQSQEKQNKYHSQVQSKSSLGFISYVSYNHQGKNQKKNSNHNNINLLRNKINLINPQQLINETFNSNNDLNNVTIQNIPLSGHIIVKGSLNQFQKQKQLPACVNNYLQKKNSFKFTQKQENNYMYKQNNNGANFILIGNDQRLNIQKLSSNNLMSKSFRKMSASDRSYRLATMEKQRRQSEKLEKKLDSSLLNSTLLAVDKSCSRRLSTSNMKRKSTYNQRQHEKQKQNLDEMRLLLTQNKQMSFTEITNNLINLNLSKAIKYRQGQKSKNNRMNTDMMNKYNKSRKLSSSNNMIGSMNRIRQNLQNLSSIDLQQKVKGWEIECQEDIGF